jgi:hypothetical protein
VNYPLGLQAIERGGYRYGIFARYEDVEQVCPAELDRKLEVAHRMIAQAVPTRGTMIAGKAIDAVRAGYR